MSFCERVAVVLVPPCTMLCVGAVVEVFEAANRLAGQRLYELSFYSRDGQPVTLQNGLAFPVRGALRDVTPGDWLFVLSEGVQRFADAGIFTGELARQAPRLSLLGGLGAGSWWLASAGLLDGYRATIHWQEAVAFGERFRQAIVSQHVFELDRDRFSCGGGLALFDGLLALIGRQHGAPLVEEIASHLCLERLRGAEERQRVPLMARLGEKQPKVTEAVMLMEANLEEPLTTDELARLTGQSRRQLERLFKQHLDMAPTRYYLQLRLERARQLLRTTGKSVVQIGLSCGFSSGPHFSTVYRAHFGIAPREERFSNETRGVDMPVAPSTQ
ncbi:GlxA family transcriptional regulator [Crenobacter sp. SG2303]|uniref:GlxA family transcriptional regulator n=1 Tax=Crenobacter oryzisoli TaxID=3056844 RepID=A0ABT7XI70_9NEIS|nr:MULTISPECIES: GlxA family transcriptional regulator [unclassified Crenobacter]MDN0073433.1 GlxA family transcriptional regulator [Crenobacter sp. SG2303]MDN0083349.1 GlxA family transcriptional regulator [Crenobacter sp. SG2305]